ncbi:hypothetical protein CBS101457_004460 [Exobasidium rhododendri]|nr:hypothetical protein CBS101457_004460 [Exobasidium rhododendri]
MVVVGKIFSATLIASLVHIIAAVRDTTFPACDSDTDLTASKTSGLTAIWQKADDKVDYVKPGLSACGETYTDQSNVVCVAPGWIHSANVNGCNKWVTIFSKESGVSLQARVLDVCGASVNTTFGCNDIFLGKQVFEELAGKNKDKALEDGHISGEVLWNFSSEPCWGCAAGLPGKLPDGKEDTCEGQDNAGNTRCGRRRGNDRILGASSAFICNQQVDTCEKVNALIPNLPKIPHLNQLSQDALNEVGAGKSGTQPSKRYHISRDTIA